MPSGHLKTIWLAGALVKSSSSSRSRALLVQCEAAEWDQCGGLHCPEDGTYQCADAATGCCPDHAVCTRQNPYYWQCLPQPSPESPPQEPPPVGPASSPPITPSPDVNQCKTADWDQCGGLTCPTGSYICADSATGCCPDGSICSRQNAYYWQCLPLPTPNSPPHTSPLAAVPLNKSTPSYPSSPPPLPNQVSSRPPQAPSLAAGQATTASPEGICMLGMLLNIAQVIALAAADQPRPRLAGNLRASLVSEIHPDFALQQRCLLTCVGNVAGMRIPADA